MILSRIRNHLSSSLYLPLRSQIRYKSVGWNSKQRYFFSEKNNKKDEEKKSFLSQSISIEDFVTKIKGKYEQQKKKQGKDFKFGFSHMMMLGIPLLLAYSQIEKQEQYPVNYFESQLRKNSSEFNELHVIIIIVNHKTLQNNELMP